MAYMRERQVVLCSEMLKSDFNLMVSVVCDDETSEEDAQKIALYKVKRELAKHDNCFSRMKNAITDKVVKFEDIQNSSH